MTEANHGPDSAVTSVCLMMLVDRSARVMVDLTSHFNSCFFFIIFSSFDGDAFLSFTTIAMCPNEIIVFLSAKI